MCVCSLCYIEQRQCTNNWWRIHHKIWARSLPKCRHPCLTFCDGTCNTIQYCPDFFASQSGPHDFNVSVSQSVTLAEVASFRCLGYFFVCWVGFFLCCEVRNQLKSGQGLQPTLNSVWLCACIYAALNRCLSFDPDQRITVEDALLHECLTGTIMTSSDAMHL